MKNITFPILFFLLIAVSSYAQVGIGTVTPNPSSMLDVSSTTQGLLAPRMTTAQRNAITSPAESLLVFDTDEDAFYFYNTATSQWVPLLSGSVERDNYKLVKSAADLAPELTAGGGTRYLLDENTYYEINGTINLTAPIDLNNAYVAGLDASEDVLTRAGGTVFQGTTGGSIRNITITGASTAFNINGPGIGTNSSLLVQNSIVSGMTTSVGSISNIGLVFGNIVQFVGNNNGITYSNIGNLLLNNQAWLGNNVGVYETFTNNFGLIEKVSGFSTVPSGNTGIDVSSNPSVSTGVLLGTVFSGGGTYVNRYSTGSYPGYNFTNTWTVNAPGIPRESDDVATGDINLDAAVGSGVATTFSGTGAGSRRKIVGTTTSNNLFRFTRDGNNRITYRGSKTRYFQLTASVSYQGTDDITLILYFAKNNTVIAQTKVYGRAASGFFVNGGILALPIVGTVELQNGDNIEIWAERFSGTGNMETVSLNLTAR